MSGRGGRTLPRRTGWAAIGAVAALLAAACGQGGGSSGSSGSGGSTAGQNAPGTQIATPGGQSAAVVTDYAAYVGGKGGKADSSLAPVTIGWVNDESGPINPQPGATKAAQAAVGYVNSELGGIGGHPLQLDTCFISQAEEEGQKCGQQLLSDSSVSVLAYGFVPVGNQSLESVVNGAKPIVVGVSGNNADARAKNTYVLYGDQTHVFAPWGTYARDVLHAKTAALVYNNAPGGVTGGQALRTALQQGGLQVKSVGYNPEATDLLGPVTAAGAQTADVIVPLPDTQGCINIAKALGQIGSRKPVVAGPLCIDPAVAKGLGGDFPKWTYGIAQTLSSDTTAPDQQAYVSTITKYGVARADTVNPFAALGWSEVLELAKLMNAAGADRVSPDSMTAQLKAFRGPLVMGPPSVQCGQIPDAPAVCNDRVRFYTYEGKGAFKASSGWLGPAKK